MTETPNTEVTLTPEECSLMLRLGSVGRVAVVIDGQPHVIPVNYATIDGVIVFRTGPKTILTEVALSRIAFEVDGIDYNANSAWSVTVKGVGRELTDGVDEASRRRRALEIQPWAGGKRDRWYEVLPTETTGRKVGRGPLPRHAPRRRPIPARAGGQSEPGPVVTGVDGSEHGRAALTWALDEARRRHVACHVVHAWDFPGAAFSTPYAVERSIDLFRSDAAELLRTELDRVVTAGVDVRVHIVQGPAGPILTDLAAATGAEVLVVGASGHGALVGTLLGSVSEDCIHHAPCPVVIVPWLAESERPDAPAIRVTAAGSAS